MPCLQHGAMHLRSACLGPVLSDHQLQPMPYTLQAFQQAHTQTLLCPKPGATHLRAKCVPRPCLQRSSAAANVLNTASLPKKPHQKTLPCPLRGATPAWCVLWPCPQRSSAAANALDTASLPNPKHQNTMLCPQRGATHLRGVCFGPVLGNHRLQPMLLTLQTLQSPNTQKTAKTCNVGPCTCVVCA